MLQVRSPYDQHLISEIQLQAKEEVEILLAKAHHLFNDQNSWLPAWQRIEILEKLHANMKVEIEGLTNRAAEEGGRPYVDSKEHEMTREKVMVIKSPMHKF